MTNGLVTAVAVAAGAPSFRTQFRIIIISQRNRVKRWYIESVAMSGRFYRARGVYFKSVVKAEKVSGLPGDDDDAAEARRGEAEQEEA